MFKRIITICGLLLFLTSCGKPDALRVDYPTITDKKHVFVTVGADVVLDLIKLEKDAIIVLGFKDCPWCQSVMPYINEIAKEKGHKKVYYVDIKDMRDNEASIDHPKYLEIKVAFSAAVDESKDRINAPTVVVIKEGKLAGYHLNTVESHELNENRVLPPLSKEQENELRAIFRNLFK